MPSTPTPHSPVRSLGAYVAGRQVQRQKAGLLPLHGVALAWPIFQKKTLKGLVRWQTGRLMEKGLWGRPLILLSDCLPTRVLRRSERT